MSQLQKLPRFAFYVFVVVSLGFAFSSSTSAQNVMLNGGFHGTVTDTSGAVIPGVKVTVTNLNSGLLRTATTDAGGFYTITQVPPGQYSVSVSKEGFSTVAQPSVDLLMNQDLEANYTLQVGSVTQEVKVTGAPAMLQTASASLGTVVGSTEAVNLPLNGRNFTQLILLTPGAAPKESAQQSGFVSLGGTMISPSTNGQQGIQDSFTVDGILTSYQFDPISQINPPPDAIEEFNVQSHMDDAKYTISSGANVSVVTKSGTAHFHGAAWEFLRNSDLDANNYFNNFSSEPRPAFRQNQFGGTFGGPVILPRYDGRQKHTYFFGFYEGFRSTQGFPVLANMPTPGEESGDFADILTTTQATGSTGQPLVDNLGRPIMNGAIYNPYSGREVTAGGVDPVTGLRAISSGIVRDPFPNNQIPANMLNPQALAYLQAFYLPPNFGPGGNSFPNFAATENEVLTADQFSVGIDHTFANNDVLNGKFYYTEPTEAAPNTEPPLGTLYTITHDRMVSLAYTHSFSPTLIGSFHFGYNWVDTGGYTAPVSPALIAATGQGPIMDQKNGLLFAPEISLAPRLTGSDQFAYPFGPSRIHELTADIQKVRGSNTFSAGVLLMYIHEFDDGWGTSVGFDQFPSSGIYGANTNVSTTGDGLASMLLNLPSNYDAFFGLTAANFTSWWYGGYVQDKWQASKKLSVQIGLRWDYLSPPHYKNNEFTMWNTNCPVGGRYTTTAEINSITEACDLLPTAYTIPPTATNPTPLEWPVPNARQSLFDPRWDGWQPRFGFAYAARPRTIIRGAFAIFDDHNYYVNETQDSRAGWPFGGQYTPTSLNRGIITSSSPTWSSPPSWTTFLPPTSNTVTIGRATQPNGKIPYAIEYNFGVQQGITPNMTLSADYVGAQDRHLWGDLGYNQPLPQNMGPNAIPNGEPFPFIGGVIQANYNIFTANYNAFQLKLEQRFSQGLTFLASYTFSKCLDDYSGDYNTWPQNSYDLRADYGPCDYNFPQLFTFSYNYQLPFGSGKRFAAGAGRGLDALIGGWNMGGILSADSGSPFTVYLNFDNANAGETDRANRVAGCQLLPSGFQQNVDHWYNPACFTLPPAYTFGNAARDAYQGPNILNFDFSLFKSFKLTESKSLQFRVETFNLFNRANFSPPGGTTNGAYSGGAGTIGTDFGTPNFMKILSAAPARQIQFALKFLF
jgi:hypothetical protein